MTSWLPWPHQGSSRWSGLEKLSEPPIPSLSRPTGPYEWRTAGFSWTGQRVPRGAGTIDAYVRCHFPGLTSEFLRLRITRRNGEVVADQVLEGRYHCVEAGADSG